MAPLANLLRKKRYAPVWADPGRALRTLESFAETEATGGVDIAAAAARTRDVELREHLERHAKDEVRHAELFRRRAAELRAGGATAAESGVSDRALDLAHGAGDDGEMNAHGFLPGTRIDDVGEIAYIAQLHVAEVEAADFFALQRDIAPDGETRAIFETILKDERYHVSYTRVFLERWKREGRGAEVKRALESARESRFLGAWKRLGLRAGASFGRVAMLAFYFTLLAPFGWLARRGARPAGWQAPSADGGARSQY